MWRQIKMHMYAMFKRRGTIISYFAMYVLVLFNFFCNVKEYYGWNIPCMYSPMKLLFLSGNHSISFYFMQYFPIFVVIPAGFAFINDKISREIIYIQARTGKKEYYIGKSIAVFLVTFLVFAVPMLFEVLLNVISFPTNAIGDQSNLNIFDPVYMESVQRYLFHDVWIFNKYIYAVLMIVVFGVASGLLGVFAGLFSSVFSFRFKIFVFIPAYTLLYLLAVSEKILHLDFSTNYFEYLIFFSGSVIKDNVFILFLMGLLTVDLLLLLVKVRKDVID
ncbi:MAG: hypothetical protein IJA27_06720 [Lachnospiraceae bacterium]|nr:hypothetical protein [Lachnospiraceae bacterium]